MTPLVITTPELPAELGATIEYVYSMVTTTTPVQISQKPLLQAIFGTKTSSWQQAWDNFVGSAPNDANAIIGVSVSTAVGSFGNGTFLYVTMAGTPIRYTTNE